MDSTLEAGMRNIVFDLSSLDYLYSDTINAFFAVNKKILASNGRFSLMSPGPDVNEVLDQSGIFNLMPCYENDGHLQRASDEIVMQTSTFNRADLQKSPSEFEDFRNEIGKTIQTDQQPTSPPPLQQSFSPPPVQPAPPPPVNFEPAQPAPPQNQYYQPSQTPPPAMPAYGGQYRTPSDSRMMQPPPSTDTGIQRRFPEEPVKKQGFPVVAFLITLFLVVGIAATAGYWFLYRKIPFFPLQKEVSQQQQLPLSDPDSSAVQADSTAAEEDEPVEETVARKETRQTTSKPSTAPKKTSVRRSPRRTASRSSASSQKRTTTQRPSSVDNKFVVTSSPPGAVVKINGKEMGKTPFVWNNPSTYGSMFVTVSRDGYKENTKTVEYTGGAQTHQVTLQREETPVLQPPASSPRSPVVSPRPDNQATETAQASAPSPPPRPSPSPPPATPPSTRASSQTGGEAATVFISSIPPVADVYMDGNLIGKTNITKLKVTSGTHSMRFVKGGKELTKEMTFEPGDNAAKHVTF